MAAKEAKYGAAGTGLGLVTGGVLGVETGPGAILTAGAGGVVGGSGGAFAGGVGGLFTCMTGGGGGGGGGSGGEGGGGKFNPRDPSHRGMTASDIISRFKKGSIRSEFPSEMLPKTFANIDRLASEGEDAAQTARMLLTDSRFNK
jgi:hypothetical protein